MWEQWKKVKNIFFGPRGPLPKIQPILFQDGLLAFRASESLKMGKQKVAAPTKTAHMEVEIEILSYDEDEDLYRGKVADEVFSLDAMQLERRGEFRLSQQVRVTSSDLPGYEATTEDISLSGARLTTQRAVKPGEYITLTFHFGDPNLPDLTLRGEYRWCAPLSSGLFHCGLRFSAIKKTERVIIKRYIQNKVAMGGI